MSLLDNLPHTCRHQRESHANDQYIGRTGTPVVVATGVECWVQNASFREIAEFQKLDENITHKVYWNAYTEKRPGDLLDTFAMADGSANAGFPAELIVRATTDRTVSLGWAYCSYCEEQRNVRPTSHT
jgi:hypothetical protein